MQVSNYSKISISKPEKNTTVENNVHQSEENIDWFWIVIGNPPDEITDAKIPSEIYVQDTVHIRTAYSVFSHM